MNTRLLTTFLVILLSPFASVHGAEPRPNILWLVCEDSNVNWFGCYGNPMAKTPHIDALAKQGFRYTHAYACAPVCAPSRSSWITGVHAISTGTQPMRSRYPIPHDQIPYYPDQLRKAGYYTANGVKTDFNIGGRPDDACWDAKGTVAWKDDPHQYRRRFQAVCHRRPLTAARRHVGEYEREQLLAASRRLPKRRFCVTRWNEDLVM